MAGLDHLNEKVPLTWKDRIVEVPFRSSPKGTFTVKTTLRRRPKLVVFADGRGLVSGAGGLLVTEALKSYRHSD